MCEGSAHHQCNLLFIISLLQRLLIHLRSLRLFNQRHTVSETEVDRSICETLSYHKLSQEFIDSDLQLNCNNLLGQVEDHSKYAGEYIVQTLYPVNTELDFYFISWLQHRAEITSEETQITQLLEICDENSSKYL